MKNRKNKYLKSLIKIATATLLFSIALILRHSSVITSSGLYFAAYVIVGYDVLLMALRNIRAGLIFDENFLMTLATAGAFIIGEYSEGVAVMLFYQIGELFQAYAVNRSRKSIAELMNIRPDHANVKRGSALVTVAPNEVTTGDIIVIKPGERIPLDSIVTEGRSTLDTSALTGESVPRCVEIGSELLSGSININSVLTARVTKAFSESTVCKILELVENAGNRKSKAENFITKFARYYTPAVVITAAVIASVPPFLINGALLSDWFYRALVFLVISCPCALVISIPLSFFGGLGGASRNGILIKGSNYLEALAKTETVIFDKTGTLTKGVFKVQKIVSTSVFSETRLLELAAYAEYYSNHPISLSIKQAYGKEIDNNKITFAEDVPGYGVKAQIDDDIIFAGNLKYMHLSGITVPELVNEPGTVIYVAMNGDIIGLIIIEDELKDDVIDSIQALKAMGIKQTVMLTGDTKEIGESMAKRAGIDIAYCNLLPSDKIQQIERQITEKSKDSNVIYAGDGINDAPALARADVGIAMGGLGADAAIEAADVVIMTDEPSKIVAAIEISKNTLRIVKQNIVFALSVKFAVLLLGAADLAVMWEAVFADVGVSVIAILNAIRALYVKQS